MEHDIITRDAYNVCWAEIWEFSKSQRDIIDAVPILERCLYILRRSLYYHIWQVSPPLTVTHRLGTNQSKILSKLECGTWYHHPRRLQCVLSRNLRIFKVATWHYRCRPYLKNNCIWDNLQYCLLVPRSPSKPVMLTIDLQSWKVLFIEIAFWHVYPGKTIMILVFIDETLPLQFAPGVNLS